MSLKQTAFHVATSILKTGIGLLGQRRGAEVSARLAEQLSPIVAVTIRSGTIHFYCPGYSPFWQADALLEKEPETIEWIDTFKAGDNFWDIGANVGVYTLYAALRSGVTVLAFEPAAVNYFVLNRNIELNYAADRVSAFCLAFSDVSGLGDFYMAQTGFGAALHAFGEAIDWQGKPMVVKFRQAALGLSIDDFIARFNPLFPNHIKIDVDGIENRIIKGARKTVSDQRLKSLLIELNVDRTEYCREVIIDLEDAGLQLQTKTHAPMFESGMFASIYNHIFTRR
jgi:FkbM family methyltransferase